MLQTLQVGRPTKRFASMHAQRLEKAVSEKEADAPIIARLSGSADIGKNKLTITAEEREEREYTVPASARSKVEDGQPVQAGDLLTEGSKDPDEVLRIQGRDAVQRYLIDEVQEVYRSQGVSINDKHIEVIARQMLRKLRVDQTGDTELLPGELVDRTRGRSLAHAGNGSD